MKAIILAAGRGSRMKHFTHERPKCLIKIRGRSLLDWQLQALRNAGIVKIGIVTGYKRELLVNRGLIEFYNSRWSETNMVSSLACAEKWLESEPCIVSYSDIFYEASAVKSLIECSDDLAVTYDPNWLELWTKRFGDPLLDAETFRLNPDGSLSEIGKKPKTIEEVEGQYMGLLRFSQASWAEVLRMRASMGPKEFDSMDMTGTLQKIINAGYITVSAIAYNNEWGEVDNVEDLASYD